jgi:uncharacterized membrane protein
MYNNAQPAVTNGPRSAAATLLMKTVQKGTGISAWAWTNRRLIGVLALFGGIYCLLSLGNHLSYRTYAYDLGIFNNAAYDYCHLRANDAPIKVKPTPTLLADHFELTYIPLSFFLPLFGDLTLLLFQIGFLLLGGVGIYRFLQARFGNPPASLAGMVIYLGFWGLFSAVAFDYHNNVLAVGFLPWLFYAFQIRHLPWAWAFWLFAVLAKETVALRVAFLALGLLLLFWGDRRRMLHAGAMSLASLGLFVLLIKVVIPALGPPGEGGYQYFDFHVLGNTPGEAIQWLATHPLEGLRLLFVNHEPAHQRLDGIKLEFWIFFLLAGGFAMLRHPQYLVMALPIIGIKLWHDDAQKWGLSYHYSAALAPLVACAAIELVHSSTNRLRRQRRLAVALALLAVAATHFSLYSRRSVWEPRQKYNYLIGSHYDHPSSPARMQQGLAQIPDTAAVCAQSPLVPHLALREKIYQYPRVLDANYIALLRDRSTYPLDKSAWAEALQGLQRDASWVQLYDDGVLYVFRRRQPVRSKSSAFQRKPMAQRGDSAQ